MDYVGIVTNSSKLKKNSLFKVTIADETKQLLYGINADINSAHEAGLTSVDVRLPINFNTLDGNVSNKELQITIYHNIVTELQRLGYILKLKFKEKFTLLTISWTVKTDTNLLIDMQNTLIKLTK